MLKKSIEHWKDRQLSRMYWSNCFIEALRLKLTHWNEMELYCVSCFMNFKNYGVFCPHFWVRSKITGDRYDFHTDAKLKFPQWLLWKGYIQIKRADGKIEGVVKKDAAADWYKELMNGKSIGKEH